MAKPPVSDHNTTSDHFQTWILRVYIHCEGCKKKVFKILQRIDGVYKTLIDSEEHKATVTGSVNGDTLVQKLLKSGKHAEILPESFKAEPPKKKSQSNKQNEGVTTSDETEHVDEEKYKFEGSKTDGGNDQQIAEQPGGFSDNNGGKKKKNKKKKGDNNTPPKEGDPAEETAVAIEKAGPEELNLPPSANHIVYVASYDMPPYNSYYPIPAYGVSYNTSYPTESSYYISPVYGYAQSHPHPSLPPYYRRSACDDHDVESEGRVCTIM